MKNLLFHIGFHKTATTWLQNEFFMKNSLFNTFSSKKKRLNELVRPFIMDKENYLLSSNDLNSEGILQSFGKFSEISNNKINVISNERLSGNPHNGGFDSLAISRRIKNVFPNAKILIVIREQKSFLLSNYYQYLSVGGTSSLKKYLNTKHDRKHSYFSPNHIKYHFIIKNYYENFGKKNVLVLPYEMFNEDSKLFLQTITEFVKQKAIATKGDISLKVNKKTNFYVNYKLRRLSIFLYSNSINNYSKFNFKLFELIVKIFKKILGSIAPNALDIKLREKHKEYIKEWSKERYKESNILTKELINSNSNYFDINKYLKSYD